MANDTPTNRDQQQLAEDRTKWAMERTLLAKERTFSAWVRTGLASLVAGLAVAKLLPTDDDGLLAAIVGAAFIAIGGAMFLIAYRSYGKMPEEMRRLAGEEMPVSVVAAITAALVVAAVISLLLIF